MNDNDYLKILKKSPENLLFKDQDAGESAIDLAPGNKAAPADIIEKITSLDDAINVLNASLSDKEHKPLLVARKCLEKFPGDPEILEMAAYAAIVEYNPENCFIYLNRLKKKWNPGKTMLLCEAVAYAQQNKYYHAEILIKNIDTDSRGLLTGQRVPPGVNIKWLNGWLRRISEKQSGAPLRRSDEKKRHKEPPEKTREDTHPMHEAPDTEHLPHMPFEVGPLPLENAKIKITIKEPRADTFKFLNRKQSGSALDYRLRMELVRYSLFRGFDDLLCLQYIKNIDHHWYQVEPARKALKHYRGRVLLADEVGLGKTIEAGMILKEYMLRGMANSVLILAPPSLVSQWKEEMESKFGIEFATTSDADFKSDTAGFWKEPRIIASIATARRKENFTALCGRNYDIVIVDEAHHCKNRNTLNWKLVDGLKKRFLLLLSATPVQNNLVELYNLLPLLKPGIFKTEKNFRDAYMTAGNPRIPANREKLHDLMRDAMVRNTRALVDVRLPRRTALTVKVEPSEDEKACYSEINRLIGIVSHS